MKKRNLALVAITTCLILALILPGCGCTSEATEAEVWLKLADSDPVIYIESSKIKAAKDVVVLDGYWEEVDGMPELRDNPLFLIRPGTDINPEGGCEVWVPFIYIPASGTSIKLLYLDPIFEPVTFEEVFEPRPWYDEDWCESIEGLEPDYTYSRDIFRDGRLQEAEEVTK